MPELAAYYHECNSYLPVEIDDEGVTSCGNCGSDDIEVMVEESND